MESSDANFVRDRAGNRCEYCRLRQEDEQYLRFHIEHIVPKKHLGSDDLANLALACGKCNRCKGTNLVGLDPVTGQMAAIFHPRTQKWEDHFEARGAKIEGRTAIGRVTVQVLNMNHEDRLQLREAILRRGSRN